MVNLRVIIRFVEFITSTLYNGVALIVIPDCTEAIAFYTQIVTAAHVGVEEQIQSLKSVVVHVLLVAVVIHVTLLKFWKVVYAISVKERNGKERFGKGC